jgi:hypothetical protein
MAIVKDVKPAISPSLLCNAHPDSGAIVPYLLLAAVYGFHVCLSLPMIVIISGIIVARVGNIWGVVYDLSNFQ